jgi:HSP20 family molecular chaperone IbpA
MKLVPWRPFGELSSFRREMDRLWDKFFTDKPFGRTFREESLPLVDVPETKDKLLIKVDLPGLEQKTSTCVPRVTS